MNQVNKVYVPYTTDESTTVAMWQFNDEITEVLDPSIFAIEGRTVVDWNFPAEEAPYDVNTLAVTYDDVIEPGMSYSSPYRDAVNGNLLFENGDHPLAESSGTVLNEPKVRNFVLSGNTNLSGGPSQAKGIALNNLTLSNVTAINVKITDVNNKDVVGLLARVVTVKITKVGSPMYSGLYNVTAVSDPQYFPEQTEDTGYRQLAVSAVDAHFALADDDEVIVDFYRY